MASKHSFALFLVLIIPLTSSSALEKHMVFYMHDDVVGANRTAITVAGVNGSSSDFFGFGTLLVIDDLLTEGLNRSSPLVGRAKGTYENADVKGGAIHFALTVYFQNKLYNGSTLEILGTDVFSTGIPGTTPGPPAEVAVVGGTRKFRYARGYAIVETVATEGLNGSIKFNVTYRLD